MASESSPPLRPPPTPDEEPPLGVDELLLLMRKHLGGDDRIDMVNVGPQLVNEVLVPYMESGGYTGGTVAQAWLAKRALKDKDVLMGEDEDPPLPDNCPVTPLNVLCWDLLLDLTHSDNVTASTATLENAEWTMAYDHFNMLSLEMRSLFGLDEGVSLSLAVGVDV